MNEYSLAKVQIIFIILITSTINPLYSIHHRPTSPSTLMGRWDVGRCDASRMLNFHLKHVILSLDE